MRQIYHKLTAGKPNYIDITFYSILLLFCYFCFNQWDILQTGRASFAYLDGHVTDFYEYYKGGASYLPSTYILFAIWNIPIKLLGIVGQDIINSGHLIFWVKLLTTLFLVASAFFMYKIGRTIGLSSANSKLMTIIWISCPIMFFSQFIFGQNDIFTVFFVLAGIYYFLRKNIWLFILFFGISFTFKYFSLFIFVPLLLFVEKNPLKILGYLAVAILPVALETLFYLNSRAMVSGVILFDVAGPRLFLSQINIFPSVSIYLFVFSWLIICGICYYVAPVNEKSRFDQVTIYICLAVSCVLFTLVFWHPQWLLFMTPFLAITAFMNRNIKYFLFLGFLIMFPFIGYTVCVWPMNVDQQMWVLGILGKFNPGLTDPDKVFTMAQLFTLGMDNVAISGKSYSAIPIIRGTYFTVFSAILMLFALFQFPTKRNTWDGDNGHASVQEYWSYTRLRFFGGLAVFIIPALIAYFVTLTRS